jgi:hypothetical protein
VTKRENLKNLNKVAALRLKKLDEIRELLSIPRNTDYREIISIVKWWSENGGADPCVPAQLKTEVNRRICDFRSLKATDMKILDKFTSQARSQSFNDNEAASHRRGRPRVQEATSTPREEHQIFARIIRYASVAQMRAVELFRLL